MTRGRPMIVLGMLTAIAGAAATRAIVVGEREAEAVIGEPATGVRYAGVARRTARRTTPTTYSPIAARPGTLSVLPAGCVYASGTYTCGSVRYRAYYDGPNLVYVVVH